ncbi:oxygen-independent coproporphyrinogen III oxidase [Sphingomonas sp. KC8]|uniref:oxygen-independent coproporphyrinogen III oxidase n=1 Tax=Sphingomonas sp. KC8 TaxID=1030157 RepID=UPI00024885FD|nr:oxygen-independent coproporphyrinogen III oxidase [Sphingomonas sp. KC8]ARS28915.1 coproporphyrinogen III oxidase [Sphingomonas sp. KC8]
MWTYHPELLGRPVPRYTSYPTAAEFHDGISEADMAAAIDAVPEEAPLSLYLHIPYCKEICWYCGCNTGAANRGGRLTAYLEALETEIDLIADRLAGRGRVRRIAFGGGSPNAIAPWRFVHLVETLERRLGVGDATLSIELDPRTLDRAWLDAIAGLGVASASLGVQTFAPQVQAAIGRIQPAEMIERATDGLRMAGVRSINFDLMYGLPHQGVAELDDSLTRTIALGADRIAVFGYAHLPKLLPRQRRIDDADLPDLRTRFDQSAYAHDRLAGAGYRAIGFDHFAQPGDPLAQAAAEGRLRRNFQGFTDDDCDYLIGMGASAISQFPGLIAQNEKMAGRYRMLAFSGRLPARRGIMRSADDRRRGRIIEQLLCQGSADLGADMVAQVQGALAQAEAAGLARFAGNRLELTVQGLPYARTIASAIDAYRDISTGGFSRAV